MSKPEIHTFEIPDPTGVGNPNNYAHFVDQYEYDNLKTQADKLAEALGGFQFCYRTNYGTKVGEDNMRNAFYQAGEALAEYRRLNDGIPTPSDGSSGGDSTD